MGTPLLTALTVRAITAYERGDATEPPGLRRLGAALGLHGIALNGGLVCGGVENLVLGERRQAVDDAVDGFRWLGLDDVADLVVRAEHEHRRLRPTGREEVSDEDALGWQEIDDAFFVIAGEERLEAAVAARLDEIDPGSPAP